jgi:hypothetical protein
VRAPLVDHHVDPDADALELGGDGERDILVERVAAGGRVERELELAWIDAGFPMGRKSSTGSPPGRTRKNTAVSDRKTTSTVCARRERRNVRI